MTGENDRANGRSAAQRAIAFSALHRIFDPSIYDIEALAMFAGLVVRYASFAGAHAMLMGRGAKAVITVAEHLSLAARRFAIAHEIGHHVMHQGVSRLPLCLGEDALATYLGSPYEREGDVFARQLLLPRKLLRAMFDCEAPSWNLVEAIARAFHVSLGAAALRLVEISNGEVALVHSRGNVIQWSKHSHRFQRNRGYIARGQIIDWNARAFDAKPGRWYAPREMWLDAWLPKAPLRTPVIEESIGVDSGAFSLVWAPGAFQNEAALPAARE